jgi:glycosyltransferase involved in cell wall biosynthesis
MRILYHHRTLGDGAEGIHISEMVNAFRQLGHEVLLIGPGVAARGGSKEAKSEKYLWIKRLLKGPFYELVEIAYNFIGYNSIRKAIKTFKPDILYDRYITFNYSAVAAARHYGLPIFLEVNAPLALERDKEPDETLYFKTLAYALEKKICCDATKTVVVSTPLKDYLTSIGVPAQTIKVLPNGVNTATFFPKKKSSQLLHKLNLSQNDIVTGFVGFLRPWHGLELLLDAFKIVTNDFPGCNLLLVGDGPIRESIENTIARLDLKEQVTITGRIPHSRVSDYVALFDIAVTPKATFYASPMKIIEYMAQKKPVIAPDMSNIRDLISHGHEGYLFEPNDPVSLASALKTLITNDKERIKFGQQAFLSVKNRLNWKNNAQFIISTARKL